MEEEVGFARAFYLCASGLKVQAHIASVGLSLPIRGIGEAVTSNVGRFFDRVRKELIHGRLSPEQLRVIGEDPEGFFRVLKEMTDNERKMLFWNLFGWMTSEVDAPPEVAIVPREISLGILTGLLLSCGLNLPEPIEMAMGGQKLSFYDWDALRLKIRESGKA